MIRLPLVVVIGFIAVAGCDRQPDAPPPTATTTSIVDDGPKWITQGASVVLPASAPADDPAIAAAIEEARATEAEARKRWEHAPGDDRAHWAVKWAAPLETGETEYIWVRPEHWSPFRIEGVLLSEPIHALSDHAGRGDRVSFPIEEFCDWAHVVKGTTPLLIEGNFTEKALTQNETESAAE